ncbi:hypothetical protein ABZX77_30485 [Streptomyces sp. NPDC004237]|uniref:hypothetical protein n=1 Tax=Streptomyces sp. NPDC004237 TaxID=3154455 RepID=UPI0033A45A79
MASPEHLQVKRLAALVPVTAEQLLDAGLPLPAGMEPPPAPRPLSRRIRWRMARADFIATLRRRVGFWIAGYEPCDDDGDW